MKRESNSTIANSDREILDFCRHVSGSLEMIAIGMLGNQGLESDSKLVSEVILVIRDFLPRLLSYVKMMGKKSIVIFAVDKWVFERDIERGFLGEALAGMLIFPYRILLGGDYLSSQEIILKRRLILELLENLALGFPELSYRFQIKPEYFLYEVMLNRIRIFPPLAYSFSSFVSGKTCPEEIQIMFKGYQDALKMLEKEGKISISNKGAIIPRKLFSQSEQKKVLFTNILKNIPRTIFAPLLKLFPQLLNFLSQRTQTSIRFENFLTRNNMKPERFIDPQKFIFIPTSEGPVSLADKLTMTDFVKKMFSEAQKEKIGIKPLGGVLNDLHLITAFQNGKERKVVVKRFKDWSGFKWFPLSLWSFGVRDFSVLGRSRLAKECAINEFLRCEGLNVPKILHVSSGERLVFMEYIEGKNMGNLIKEFAKSSSIKKQENIIARIRKAGELFAKIHSLSVTLGDTKPENVIVDSKDEIYFLDFEQASRGGDNSWDLAVFLYYSGHYLQPWHSNGQAEVITKAFIDGYLNGGGNIDAIRKAAKPKYTRIFSVFTMPSIISTISNICKNFASNN